MGSVEDKSALLSQLKIDRNAPSRRGPRRQLLATAILSALVGAALTYWVISPATLSESGVQTPSMAPTQHAKDAPQASVKNQANLPADSGQAGPSSNQSRGTPVLNASGYITARLVATVSAEVLGLIKSVEVEEGMAVAAGQVLAKLDDEAASVSLRLAQAQVEVQKARLNSIRAQMNEAQRVLNRISKLKDQDYSSESEFTRAQADVDRLEAEHASVTADLKVAKLSVERQREILDNHTIRAPFAGVVTQKNAQPGEIVSPSSAGGGFTRTGICTVVDMMSLEIEVDVNEAYIGRVFTGQQVVANLDAYPDLDIPARVIAIIPTADRAKATVQVRIGIEEKDSRILPDMGVKVIFLKAPDAN